MARRDGTPLGMPWHLTITTVDSKRLVFHGSSPDRAEIERLAAWAHEQQPSLRILIRPPAGPVKVFAPGGATR
jgi:hypothetical protein